MKARKGIKKSMDAVMKAWTGPENPKDARIAELEKDLSELREYTDGDTDHIQDLIREGAAKDARIAELESGLWKYGNHLPRCFATHEGCMCEFSQFLGTTNRHSKKP